MSAPFLRKLDNLGVLVDDLLKCVSKLADEMVGLESRIKELESRKPVGRPPKDGRKEATGSD
jgi:hypothetical protein